MNPSITICLPVFNGEEFLAEAIESIFSQTVHDFELLIPDDTSTDGSFDIIEKYARKDKRIKAWKNHKRLGLFGNYNQCLRNALGKYIKPMAQDDIMMPSMLKRCLEVFSAREDLSLVSTRRHVIDRDGKTISSADEIPTPKSLCGDYEVYPKEKIFKACLYPIQNIIGEPCTVMFKTASAQRGFSEKLRHIGDLEMWLRLLDDGEYSFIDEELVQFRKHNKSASTDNLNQLVLVSDMIHMADLVAPYISKIGLNPQEFILSNLACMSDFMGELIKSGELSQSKLLADQSLTRDEELGLKKALLYGIMLMSQNEKYQTPGSKARYSIAHSEKRVRQLMQSFPWKSTRSLREINRYLRIGSNISNSEENFLLLENDEYLEYLRKQKRKILTSRSWKVGRTIQSILESTKLS